MEDKIQKDNTEYVHCRIHAVVKNWIKVEAFLQELEKQIKVYIQDTGKKWFRKYKTLGSADLLIEIDSISLAGLLGKYKTGELLTHSNEYYKEAFYNLESEILIQEVKEDAGTMD